MHSLLQSAAQFHSVTPLIRPGSCETGRGRGLWRIPIVGSGAEGARRIAASAMPLKLSGKRTEQT